MKKWLDKYQNGSQVKYIRDLKDQLLNPYRPPVVDNTAAPILLPHNLNYDGTRVVNGPSAGLTKTQLKSVNQSLKKMKEIEKRQEIEDYIAAETFHDYNPLALALGTRKKPVSTFEPTTRELLYGAGAGIGEFYDVPKIGIANDFVNPLSIVSKGIIKPWLQAPLQAQQSDSYLPYGMAAFSTGLTVPMVLPSLTFVNKAGNYLKKGLRRYKPMYAGADWRYMQDHMQDLKYSQNKPIETPSVGNVSKSAAQNLEDLKYAQEFANRYGYELPQNLERIAQSEELTNRTIRGLMDRHNTFVRGVSTNWEELEKRNPEILRHLEGKGFDLSSKEGTKAAAEYMATHIPINTGYGRASLNNNVFSQGLEGLYTSNSIPTAEGYTYGQGYIVKAKRPTNYSSLNRQDWINLNNPEYYEYKLPGDLQTFKINGKLAHTDDLNTGYMYNLENYKNINDFKNKVLFDLQEKADRLSDIIKRKPNNENFINNTKNGLNETLKQIEDIKNSKWEKNLDINFEKKLLKTEHKPGFFGENFGDFGNSAEEISAALSKSSVEQKMHSHNLLNIIKDIGKKQNKEIANLLDQEENLINKTIRTAKENQELKTLQNKIIDLRWSGQNEVFQKESEYLSKHFPGWEDKKNMYAHYIHLGTPGEKVLQPIKSWEITPEIWKNKSRAHTNYYTNKLSGMSNGGAIITNRGQWDYPGQTTIIPSNEITMRGVDYPVLEVDNTGYTKMMQPGMDYTFPGQYVTEYPMMQGGGQMIKRADGSYSRPGLWDNIRKNAGSGKKPTAQMLEQERKIRNKYQGGGVIVNAGGEKHRIYIKPTNRGEGVKGHVMVNHPTMDKGIWDTIDLTEKAGATTIAQGVAATKKWHRENPYKKQDGGEEYTYWRTGKPMVNDPSMDAISKVLLQRNLDKNFMQRAAGFGYQGGIPTRYIHGQDPNSNNISSLLMGSSDNIVFPTIIQTGPEQLSYQPYQTQEYLEAPSWDVADYFATKGYKRAANDMYGMEYQKGGSTYQIQKGDTLSNISNRYNVPLNTLANANNIQNPNLIKSGNKLIIPEKFDRELRFEEIPTTDNKKIVIDNFSPHYDYIIEGDKTYYKTKNGKTWADISDNASARANLLNFINKNNYWAGYGSNEKETFLNPKKQPVVNKSNTYDLPSYSFLKTEKKPVIVKTIPSNPYNTYTITPTDAQHRAFQGDVAFSTSGIKSSNKTIFDPYDVVNNTYDMYQVLKNGIKRKTAFYSGDSDDLEIKQSYNDTPLNVEQYYKKYGNPNLSDVFDIPGNNRQFKSEQLDLSTLRFKPRNRGEYSEFNSEGMPITIQNPFVLPKELKLNDNNSVIGIDNSGNFVKGQFKDFKNRNDVRISRSPMNRVVSFDEDANGVSRTKPDAEHGNKNFQVPIVNVLSEKDNKTIEKGSLNILTKSGKENFYGSVQGGRFVMENPDNKKTYLVSGSLSQIKQKFKEIKGNSKYVNVYTLDNGTYSRGLAFKDNKFTQDRLRAYDNENLGGGGNGLYITGYDLPVNKYKQEIIQNMPNIRNKNDKSYKEGHKLKNEIKNIVLHHTAYTNPLTNNEEVKKQYMTPGNNSSHIVIEEDGKRTIYASPEQVTFHAGESKWNNRNNVNDFSIGVEFQGNTNKKPLTQAQIESFAEYYAPIAKKYNLSLKDLITHQMIAPGRKPDISQKEYSRILKYMQSKGYKKTGGEYMAIGGQSTLNPVVKKDNRNWLEYLKD